ncbi:MAG: hypothetical protein ABJA02_03685 [Acidobacteriota bacterium]
MKNKVLSVLKHFVDRVSRGTSSGEDGSAMVIALMIMILLMGFVALAVSRTNSETVSASNDESETKAFEAANASLEIMTRNFNKVFETKLTIDTTDITRINSQVPPVFDTDYIFSQNITQTAATKDVVMTGEFFQGLNARRDEWQLDTNARDKMTGVQVSLRRKFLNNRIPVFQFGIFYDDDLEFHPGPRFDFGGRVHSNGSIFLQAQTGLYFSSKVTSAANIFTDVSKNGSPYTNWGDNTFIKNGSGVYVQLRNTMGSVLANTVNGSPFTSSPLPTAYKAANWTTNQNQFQGNLLAYTQPLQLPIKINSDITGLNLDLVEVIKRGKNIGDVWNDGSGTVSTPNLSAVSSTTLDDKVTAAERYYNKTGIRVSITDSKAKLPGCATTTGSAVSTACGIRLDGDTGGQTAGGTNHVGYQPRSMGGSPAYTATSVNGERFFTGGGTETWIKVETVVYNPATITYDTQDITQDFLALGVTDPPPCNTTFAITDAGYNTGTVPGSCTTYVDSRSVINLQRFVVEGPNLADTNFLSAVGSGTTAYNYVSPGSVTSGTCPASTNFSSNGDVGTIPTNQNFFPAGFTANNRVNMRNAKVGSTSNRCVVPFPINMFDTREGLYNDTSSVFNPTSGSAPGYGSNVPWAGVMSMVDIDVRNLKTFLDGTLDAKMPTGTPYYSATGHVLRGADIPQNNGWVFYVSDRRGDYDFDGEYDMEDVYGNNDGILQAGEDINGNGLLQADYAHEAVKYTGGSGLTATSAAKDVAAVFDHVFYRRGVRLVNGSQPPGGYDSTTPANTKGFTFASENGVYVLGNYNATGISSVGTPTAANLYLPQGANDIPVSIAGDSITVLSNAWTDGGSFVYPFNLGSRAATETTQRFAMLSGDTITTLNASPNQGGGDLKMNGGVHNFLRFLENWGGTRLNYSGSLINLFNSHNNNGTFKCCNTVYSPPDRNWIFDASFLDVNRLPPGTPYFQNIQMTGFQRVN